MPASGLVGIIRTIVEWAALGIEMLGAAVIVAGVLRVAITRGTVRYLYQLDKPGAYERYKHRWADPCFWAWSFWSRAMSSVRWLWSQV
jgi:hypothetical protein